MSDLDKMRNTVNETRRDLWTLLKREGFSPDPSVNGVNACEEFYHAVRELTIAEERARLDAQREARESA